MEFRNEPVGRRCLAFLLSTFVLVEGVQSAPQTQATSPTAASGRTVLLKEGTEVTLKFHERLPSKTAVEGDLVDFVLDSDLKVGKSRWRRPERWRWEASLAPTRLEC
jgi:hypothetical protein